MKTTTNQPTNQPTSIRSNSAIEVLRVVLLVFLLFTHIHLIYPSLLSDYMDINIIHMFSQISVDAFALITGLFIFKRSSLFFRNISRLIIIIFFSILISFPILFFTKENIGNNLMDVLLGSWSAWYLYGILIIYMLSPWISKIINYVDNKYILLVSIVILFGIIIGQHFRINQIITVFGGNQSWSWLFLFAMVLIGSVIGRTKNKYRFLIYYFFISLWISVSLFYSITRTHTLSSYLVHSHISIFVMIGACGIVGIVNEIKWTSKTVNWVVKHLYFIYEYHWIIFFLYRYIFKEQLYDASTRHLYTYVILSLTLITLIPLSFAITRVQIPFSKWLTPIMQNKWDKLYKKIYNPNK